MVRHGNDYGEWNVLEIIKGMDWSGDIIPDCVYGLKPEIQAEHDRLHIELKNNKQWDVIFRRYGDCNQHMIDHLNKLHVLEQQGAFVRGAHCPISPGDLDIKHWCILCVHTKLCGDHFECQAPGMYNIHVRYDDTCRQFSFSELLNKEKLWLPE